MTQLDRFLNTLRRRRLSCAGVRLGRGARIAPNVEVQLGTPAGTIELGPTCQLERGVVLHAYSGSIRCGENVHFGPYSVVYGHGGIEIGAHTLIAMHCCIVAANHAAPPPGELIRFKPDVPLPIKIGRDVWLGAGVKVLGGVTIGDGCIVGAGAVVTGDLPPYSIAVGMPARVVGQRK
ncbi:MAG TPA: acyltransferase [Opitutaceae bacterium]|jgi:acetyltransferase-like isoleucine patch superfamily enzyme|nr:acyltransferase [Opitutaceae bacterium]